MRWKPHVDLSFRCEIHEKTKNCEWHPRSIRKIDCLQESGRRVLISILSILEWSKRQRVLAARAYCTGVLCTAYSGLASLGAWVLCAIQYPAVLAARAYSAMAPAKQDDVIRGRFLAISGEHFQSVFLHDSQQLERHAAGLLSARLPLLHCRFAGVQMAGEDRLADAETLLTVKNEW